MCLLIHNSDANLGRCYSRAAWELLNRENDDHPVKAVNPMSLLSNANHQLLPAIEKFYLFRASPLLYF